MTSLPVIPSPVRVEASTGRLDVRSITAVSVNDARALGVATTFRDGLAAWGGPELTSPAVDDHVNGSVRFELRASHADLAPRWPGIDEEDDAHRVVVGDASITVSAEHLEGLARGAATVTQLLARPTDTLPCVQIDDQARWGWRGLSVDVVRWFIPLEHLKRIVDLIALYKFNVLHLHLSDNEGWRLEIPGWPELTPEAGTTREYFTVDEFDELVAYAAERFITVVPEIDMPGHVGAALRAYPALNPKDAEGLEGPFPIANLSTESELAWSFVEDTLSTLAAHTPGPYIHIGGDEAFGMDADAHIAFVNRAMQIVRRLGKRTVGWQETSRADAGPDHIAQYWVDFKAEGADKPQTGSKTLEGISADSVAALGAHFAEAMRDGERIDAKGARVLLSPLSRAYLDRPHGERSWSAAQESLRARVGLQYYPGTPVRDYLEWDALQVLPDIDPSRIVGIESAVWCESVEDLEGLEALLLPRLPGIAEVAWGAQQQRDWDEYRNRLAEHAPLWAAQSWRWFEVETVDWLRV